MDTKVCWSELVRRIRQFDPGFRLARRQQAAGGCIHSAWILEGVGKRYFVKLNRANLSKVLAAEAAGLKALAATGTVRVPQPLAQGRIGQIAFLVLEHLPLSARTPACDRLLGERLAALHAVPRYVFGWCQDNFIGTTLQPNQRQADWPGFWRRQRLGFQLQLAADKGFTGKLQQLGERVLAELDRFFTGYRPYPALLHGDLWCGNAAAVDGMPAVFDPACYWGDREADIAMTELFGGFSPEFYRAYDAILPRDPGYQVRKDLYNLYHVLNHLNLFGGSYRAQAEAMMQRLLAEIH